MINWVCQSSSYDRRILAKKFKKLTDWERGVALPIQNQLVQFTNTIHLL